MDLVLAYIFISLARFFIKQMKQANSRRGYRGGLTCLNRIALGVAVITFLFEVYYQLCYIIHRYIKELTDFNPEDVECGSTAYGRFRFANLNFIDPFRNFWTSTVILFLFYRIAKHKESSTAAASLISD